MTYIVDPTAYSLDEIVAEAFDTIGVGAEGEAISADMYRRGKASLNLMILSWNAQEDLWRRENVPVTLLAGTAVYPIEPKPMRITNARRKQLVGGYETPMTEWSRQEYFDQPNKTTSLSTPVNFYYDPQRDVGNLYVWPAPSAAVATQTIVIVDLLRPMFPLNLAGDSIDFPMEWRETVVYNLAQRLLTKYPADASVSARVDGLAEQLFAKLKGWDLEPASVFLQPDDRWGYGYGYSR